MCGNDQMVSFIEVHEAVYLEASQSGEPLSRTCLSGEGYLLFCFIWLLAFLLVVVYTAIHVTGNLKRQQILSYLTGKRK